MAHARCRRHTGRGHVAGGHACPRVHTDARVGRHVAEGVGIWRAHGLVGPGKFIGAVMQMLTAPLHYIGASSIYFCRVGLCPHGNYLCRTRGATRGVGFDREEERLIDRVDPSPCDHQSRHVLKNRISERDQRTYQMTRGSVGSVRFSSQGDHRGSSGRTEI